MRFSIVRVASMALQLSGIVTATRAGAYVYGCLWMPQKPDEPFSVDFKAGGTEDSCMTRHGRDVEKKVEKAGLTCESVGWVEADENLSFPCGCFCKESRWGLSYTTSQGVTYSGATGVQWKTGPSNTEVILRGQSPGTHICPSQAKCSRESFEWSHATNAHVYVVFEPLAV